MRPMQPRRTRRARERAFTLIELMVVIAIIAIMAATLLPIVTQPFITERRAEAVREMAAIEEGIFGRPEVGDFGYLGTMGRMPVMTNSCTGGTGPQALCELVTQGTQAAPTLSAGVAVGWQGPYLRVATNQPLVDPWGQPYVLSLNPATPQGTSVQLKYQLRSSGPDGQANTTDDIYFPLNAATWWNAYVETLQVDLAMAAGPALAPVPTGTKVTLSYPFGNGVMATLPSGGPFITGVDGRATFTSTAFPTAARIPFGMLSLSIDVGGTGTNVVTRQIVALKPVSAVQVVVPAGANVLSHVECGLGTTGALASGATAGCTIPSVSAALSIFVQPGQVIDATFTGGWHANGGTCYGAISFGDATALSLYGAQTTTFQPAVTQSPTAYTTIATSRTWQYPPANPNGTALPVNLMVANNGAGTCTIDSGTLSVKTWKP